MATKLKVKKEQLPPTPMPTAWQPTGGVNPIPAAVNRNSNIDQLSDLRDSIGALVGSGYTGLKTPGSAGTSDVVRAHVTRIINSLPVHDAQSLLTHISVYNQNPSMSRLSPTQRLQQFYDVNSGNSGTQGLLQRVKALGTGPMSAFRETPELLNQQLAAVTAKK